MVSAGVGGFCSVSQQYYATEINLIRLVLFCWLLFQLWSGILFITNILIRTGYFWNGDRARIEDLKTFCITDNKATRSGAVYSTDFQQFCQFDKSGTFWAATDWRNEADNAESTKRIQRAPDENVITYMQVILEELRYYQEHNRSEMLCFKALFPQVSGELIVLRSTLPNC